MYNNYPNPFNPNTKIKFDLPRDSDVKITIFDISGKMVQELLSMALPAGTYEKSFNATALSSGIYYYKIETGSFIDTKKMILVK